MNIRANSSVIPEDLILQIFSRLPEKSILRFLSLSKSWKSLIRSQYFIDLFKSTSKPYLLVLRENPHDGKFFSSHPHVPSSPVADSVFLAKLSEYHIPYKGYTQLSYASGLFYFRGKVHGICDPSTRQYAILPNAPIRDSYGFLGFDPVGNQFKILLYKRRSEDEVVFDILILGSKNEREREVKCPSTYVKHITDSICINGVLYFRLYRGEFISCFDVRYEKIFQIEYPGLFKKFVDYKGKLGLVRIDVYDGDSTGYHIEITIWVLEDLDKEEWRAHVYRVGDLRPEITPKCVIFQNLYLIGVTDSGDVVLAKKLWKEEAPPFYLFCFNPSDPGRLRRVKIEGDCKDYEVHYFMNHRAYLGFDIMKKTAETCMYESGTTEASTSSSNDDIIKRETSTSSEKINP